MRGAGIHPRGHSHTRIPEPSGHLQVLLGEHIALGDGEAHRREAFEVGSREAGARVALVRGRSQVVGPEIAHLGARQHEALAPIEPGRLVGAVGLETGVVEQQSGDGRMLAAALIAQPQAGGHRQIPPCRVPTEHDPGRVDPERRALPREQPARHRCHLLERGRKPRLGRERVIDADDHQPRAGGILAHHPIVGVEAEDHPAAAVHVDERRPGGGGTRYARVIDTYAHTAGAERHL